jgi:hypothetical protein
MALMPFCYPPVRPRDKFDQIQEALLGTDWRTFAGTGQTGLGMSGGVNKLP